MASFTVVAPPAQDTTPPVVSATVAEHPGSATVTVTATDTESGVKTIEFVLDGGSWTVYSGPLTVGTPGPHTVRYRATDVAGNVSAVGSVSFTVVPTGTDACPNSDDRPTVVIDGDDTGVANVDSGNGCTVNDLIAEHADYADHAAFVRHVQAVTGPLVTGGVLSARNQGAVVRAAARSDIGS
jgi:hypothetical protein